MPTLDEMGLTASDIGLDSSETASVKDVVPTTDTPEVYQPESNSSSEDNDAELGRQIELNEAHICAGTISVNGEAARVEVSFGYYEAQITALDLAQSLEQSEQQRIQEGLEILGLNNFNFSVHSREAGDLQKDLKEKNIYVLLHGWTADQGIYKDVHQPNGLTSVEEIMARDENAVVVTLDGNGFGGTTFRSELVEKGIGARCSPEAYAAQVDFLLADVLNFPDDVKENVSFMGHSMGGAAALIISATYPEYGDCIAAAPAIFPTADNFRELDSLYKELETETMEVSPTHKGRITTLLAKAGIRTPTDVVYGALGGSTWVGSKTKAYFEATTKGITQFGFKATGTYLMGREITGDVNADRDILKQLHGIHVNEFEEYGTVSETIMQLKRGVDFSRWSLEDFARLQQKTEIVTGANDTLVTQEDVRNFFRVTTAYEMKLGLVNPEMQSPDAMRTIKASIFELEDTLKDPNSALRTQLPGGHYAPVYSERTITSLTDNAKRKRLNR